MNTKIETYLEHSGVKGMKWGIRRSRSRSNLKPTRILGRRRLTKEQKAQLVINRSKKKEQLDFDLAREKQFSNEYKNRDKMSTRQLKNRVERLQTEQRFKELTERPAKERAEQFAKERAAIKARNARILKAALTVYGNAPLDKSKYGQSQKWALAFKDAPTILAGSDGGGKKKK